MGKWKTLLKKRTFERMLHLAYLDMNVLPTWFILLLRKTTYHWGEEGNNSVDHGKYQYNQSVNILLNFYN